MTRGDDERWASLERDVDVLRRRLGIAGMAAGFAVGGETVWSGAFGAATVDRGCSVDTRFDVASLTKPVASIFLLRLVERGRIDVEAPIAKFVPDDSPFMPTLRAGPTVTIGDVWSHTSGLRLLPMNRKHRLFPPGAQFRYNGAAFGLLTHVIEQRAETRIADAARDLLMEFGMSDSSPGVGNGSDDRTAYWRRPNRLARRLGRERRRLPISPSPSWWERALGSRPGAMNAAAGLVSTVPDLLLLDQAIEAGTAMTDAAKRLAWTPRRLRSGVAAPYGLGWFVTRLHDEPVVWHYGYRPGINSSLWMKFPARGCTFIALANSGGLSAETQLGRGDLATSPLARLVATAVHDL
jgi:CubicO group peptidase (beta-lactamase class C family)